MAKGQGFAALTLEERRAVAGRGGKAAHAAGKAHTWTSEEARAAGRKGGMRVSQDRSHMSMLGKKGGAVGGRGRRKEVDRGSL